ncbi:hypothetical protein E2C01_094622 [Portunus trituberculatus]|uniref:Uncharacterized protein n=1 Tax=Portunus trituberculatus TaxID=210409 RepID=A0A5B7JSV7_PORTR|nr:hypothetical protein [Portunus trituberculatus]
MRVSAAPLNRCNPPLTLCNDLANKFRDLAVPQSITNPRPESQCKAAGARLQECLAVTIRRHRAHRCCAKVMTA